MPPHQDLTMQKKMCKILTCANTHDKKGTPLPKTSLKYLTFSDCVKSPSHLQIKRERNCTSVKCEVKSSEDCSLEKLKKEREDR